MTPEPSDEQRAEYDIPHGTVPADIFVGLICVIVFVGLVRGCIALAVIIGH